MWAFHSDKTLRTFENTLGKCRKHSPATCVFYISLVFSNARRVLSQCDTRLRLLYLLNSFVTDYDSSFAADKTEIIHFVSFIKYVCVSS